MTPADLNGLVLFGERRNLVSARVPSRFKRSLLHGTLSHFCNSEFYLTSEVMIHKTTWTGAQPISMPLATHETQIKEKAGVATLMPLVGIRNHECSTRAVDQSTIACLLT